MKQVTKSYTINQAKYGMHARPSMKVSVAIKKMLEEYAEKGYNISVTGWSENDPKTKFNCSSIIDVLMNSPKLTNGSLVYLLTEAPDNLSSDELEKIINYSGSLFSNPQCPDD